MKLLSFTGPSGVGKDYLKKIVLKQFPFIKELVWVTTRSLRLGEKESGNRKSVSQEEFNQFQSEGRLILIQELGGQFYGLEVPSFLRNESCPELFITELHIDNVSRIEKELGIKPIHIALLPSGIDFLEYRLNKRRSESPEEIRRRLLASVDEVEKMHASRHHFSLTLTVSKENEGSVHHELLLFLQSQIN